MMFKITVLFPVSALLFAQALFAQVAPERAGSTVNGQPQALSAKNVLNHGTSATADTLTTPGSLSTALNINSGDLGSEINLVAKTGRHMAYFQSPNDNTAPWFVIRDGFVGTRGAGGPGDGNGPHLVFQSWSAATHAFVSSVDWNCGLIKAGAPIASDCDVVGYRSGINEVMIALDGRRPALIPGTDSNYALGDVKTGANHSLQRWTYGYFSDGVCVGCTTAAPTDPFQAGITNYSNRGVNLASGTGILRISPSFAGRAYNSIVASGDSGIVPSIGTSFVIAPQMTGSGQGSRWNASGVLTQTGPLIVTGSNAYLKLPKSTVASLPNCRSDREGDLAAVTDATSTTFNAALSGNGRNHVMAYCNGTRWTVH